MRVALVYGYKDEYVEGSFMPYSLSEIMMVGLMSSPAMDSCLVLNEFPAVKWV